MGTHVSFMPSFSQTERFLYFTQELWSPAKALWNETASPTTGTRRAAFSFQSKLGVSYFSSSFTFQACPGSPPKVLKMETLTTTYPVKYSVPKARVFVVFLSMVLCTAILCLLQLRFFKPKIKDFYSFEVKDSRGRIISLEKYRGKVSYNFIISLSWIFTERQASFCTLMKSLTMEIFSRFVLNSCSSNGKLEKNLSYLGLLQEFTIGADKSRKVFFCILCYKSM